MCSHSFGAQVLAIVSIRPHSFGAQALAIVSIHPHSFGAQALAIVSIRPHSFGAQALAIVSIRSHSFGAQALATARYARTALAWQSHSYHQQYARTATGHNKAIATVKDTRARLWHSKAIATVNDMPAQLGARQSSLDFMCVKAWQTLATVPRPFTWSVVLRHDSVLVTNSLDSTRPSCQHWLRPRPSRNAVHVTTRCYKLRQQCSI